MVSAQEYTYRVVRSTLHVQARPGQYLFDIPTQTVILSVFVTRTLNRIGTYNECS